MLQSFQSRKEIAKRHPYFYIDQKRKDQIIMIVISFICEEFFFPAGQKLLHILVRSRRGLYNLRHHRHYQFLGTFLLCGKFIMIFLSSFFCGTFITPQNAHVLQSVFWEDERLFTIFTNAKQLWDSKSAMMNDAKRRGGF